MTNYKIGKPRDSKSELPSLQKTVSKKQKKRQALLQEVREKRKKAWQKLLKEQKAVNF